MKPSTLLPAISPLPTLFQMAARMEIPPDASAAKPAAAITEKTFADLRTEAEAAKNFPARGGLARPLSEMLVSFDAIRLSVITQTFARLRRPA